MDGRERENEKGRARKTKYKEGMRKTEWKRIDTIRPHDKEQTRKTVWERETWTRYYKYTNTDRLRKKYDSVWRNKTERTRNQRTTTKNDKGSMELNEWKISKYTN